jgi:hypothetical protein
MSRAQRSKPINLAKQCIHNLLSSTPFSISKQSKSSLYLLFSSNRVISHDHQRVFLLQFNTHHQICSSSSSTRLLGLPPPTRTSFATTGRSHIKPVTFHALDSIPMCPAKKIILHTRTYTLIYTYRSPLQCRFGLSTVSWIKFKRFY